MRCCTLCSKKGVAGSGPFFRVPQDPRKREQWSKLCQKNLTPSSFICIDHFSQSDIISAGIRCLLMPNAMPIVQQQNKTTMHSVVPLGFSCPTEFRMSSEVNPSGKPSHGLHIFSMEEFSNTAASKCHGQIQREKESQTDAVKNPMEKKLELSSTFTDMSAKIKPKLEYEEESTTSPKIEMENSLIKLEPYEILEINEEFLSTPTLRSIGIQTDCVYENNLNLSSAVSEVASVEENINFLNEKEGNIISDIPIVHNPSGNSQLDDLLQKFNLNEVKPYLTKAEITFDSLRYLSEEDIKEAIPPIGIRACFREKLFSWRKTEYGIDDGSLSESIAQKVISWLQNQSNISSISSPSTSVGNSKLSKSLKLILEESPKGRSIIVFYKQNNSLTDSFRAELINIILEDTFHHETKLSSEDFPIIVDEIVKNFPNEIKEYYFIPRIKKTNPGGKLWDKYRNQRSKRERLSVKIKNHLDASNSISISPLVDTEIDEFISLSLKVSLSRDFLNWDEVKDKWQQTFLLRQKELKSSTNIYEFLSNWPLYFNARSEELINIDFELLHPNKSKLLFSKWQGFTQKIVNYYNIYIKDKRSQEVLINSKDTTEQNSLDFIYTILLNAVILPSARFLDNVGKNVKKISIPDANDSFIVHLTSINDYEKVISELRSKYYNRSLTVQPFLIVVGQSIFNLEKFYVYFDKTLLQFDSFLKSLDICFKIFYTLSLEYPKGCQGPWHFIQEYFYEVKPVSDSNLSSIYSLLNFLKATTI